MKQILYKCIDLKKIVLASFALTCSVVSMGQTAQPAPAPQQTQSAASDDDMDHDAPPCKEADCCDKRSNDNKFMVFSDFGGSTIYNAMNGNTTSATGLSWAVSGQLVHEFHVKSPSTRLFLSYGLELRNFNGTLSSADGEGSTAYDNYHFWYANVPVMFSVVNVPHVAGHFNDVGFYAQFGLSLGFKVDMLDVYSIQGNNSWNDVNDQYTTVMLHHYLSAGVAVRTRSNTWLFGPYVGYVFTNMSKVDGLQQNVLSYGARASLLLFK
jgi:hypothetical protein